MVRFVRGGPSLPDDLLTARDAAQVLFFCGAGVSQAEASLPNFPTLAEMVLTSLGSALDSPGRRLFDASRKFEGDSKLTGLVATDRIFGLLEQEFEPADVREAVALALRPKKGYRLDAHQTLLDLSRTHSGVARLVTTNFDLLFEECDPSLASFNPPHLPDPLRERDFRGVIHIHGRVDCKYQYACDDEFVLSSADFGRAYLSDGWATSYIRKFLQRFKIVFVGYSADDPPVQYLLEALNRSHGLQNSLYAFQDKDIEQAPERWAQKGVCPLPYDSSNRHAALWDTLRAWAERARDVDGWHRNLIAVAQVGPEKLQPFQRGMVAHLASTSAGARYLATATNPPPASWVGALDPRMRYGQPGPIDPNDEDSSRLDPFDVFRLDSDLPPEPSDPDDWLSPRSAPKDAWDGFASSVNDHAPLSTAAAGQLRGNVADLAAALPPRLWHLGMYLIRVAHQSACLWWAAHQAKLHPDIQQGLERSLRRETDRYPPPIREGWRFLLASWQQQKNNPDHGRYAIEDKIKNDGWSTAIVREAMALYHPFLEVKPAHRAKAPNDGPDLNLHDILHVGVEYPRPHEPLAIPPEYLAYAVSLFRQNIELAIAIERESKGDNYIFLDTIRADDGNEPDENYFGLTGHLVTYTNMIVLLAAEDVGAARSELARWPTDTNAVFTHLRIWAASRPELLAPTEAGEVFLSLTELSFWSHQHERDLLFSLRDRWADLPFDQKRRIETRLLEGHFPWPEPRDDEAPLNAHHRLNRLHWLQSHGVRFHFDVDAEIVRLRAIAPDWEPRFAEQTTRPMVGKLYRVESNTDPEPLRSVPLNQVLLANHEASRREFGSHVERRPFQGLAASRPARALGVLTDAMRRGAFDSRAWADLLHAQGKAATSPRILMAIGHRLARLTLDQLAILDHRVSEWLRDRGETLLVALPGVFDVVWNAMIKTLASHPPIERFRRPDHSWVDEGLNCPAGRMVNAVFADPKKADLVAGAGLPQAWRQRFDQLLDLPGGHRRHAIAMISRRLSWLYCIDPDWTEAHLLTLADRKDADSQAFWDGYLSAAALPQLPLYRRLGPALIDLARSGTKRRHHTSMLASIFLAGWSSDVDLSESEGSAPNVELREILIHGDEQLRTQMLWCIGRWASTPGSSWQDRLLPFLRNVWPRQRAVRTGRVSGKLAGLALLVPEKFPEIVAIILPWLTPAKELTFQTDTLLNQDQGVARRYPESFLDLLYAVLPEDPIHWPYDTLKLLDALEEIVEISCDPRLAELRRRQSLR